MEFTKEIFKKCMPNVSSSNIDKFYLPLSTQMIKHGINTPLRICHFLSQLGHECGDFKFLHELGSNSYLSKYDTGRLAKSLGNTPESDGDGQLYKGRGCIQITGKSNYTLFSKWYYGDDRLLKSPGLVETDVNLCVASAIWYWESHKLNSVADTDNIVTMTRKINGGTNGLADRKSRLSISKLALNIK